MVPGGQPDGVGIVGGFGQRPHEPEDGGQVREVVVPAVRLAPGRDEAAHSVRDVGESPASSAQASKPTSSLIGRRSAQDEQRERPERP